MDEEVAVRCRIRIADLVVDPGTHLVTRGEDVIELPRLSFRLLMALIEAAPAIQTYDELIERVWAGRIVSQETVTQRIKLLRQALGDDAQDPRYIRMARGEGYRLLPVVEILPPAEGGDGPIAHPPRWRFRAVAGLVVLAVLLTVLAVDSLRAPRTGRDVRPRASAPPPNSLAVLPFVNASDDAADTYISEGLGDELREQLGRVLGLRIAARASSVAFRNRAEDAKAVAGHLGVAWLIDGTVRREGEKLRISVQVVDGSTGFQSWSRSYSLRMQNLLEIQQQIAEEVVQQLLPLAGDGAPQPKPVTRNVSANELMLLARHYEQQVREESIVDQAVLLKAIELYREAIVADPESAIAHSRLGGALLYLGDVDAAEAPIFEALRLDPDLADAHYALGLYFWLRHMPGSGAAYERAIQLNPNHADALSAYAKWIWHQGDATAPEAYFRRALSLDPVSHRRYEDLGTFLGHSGRSEAAHELAAEIARRFSDGRAAMILARIYELTGELDTAIAWALEAKRQRPDDVETDWMVAELYARINDFDDARRYEPDPGIGQLYWQRRYAELIDLAEELLLDNPGDLPTLYALGRAYNATGRFDQAVRILERAGLPGTALADTRHAPDLAAMVVLADSYRAVEHAAAARELADWSVRYMQQLNDSGAGDTWWPNLYAACGWSILGDSDRALDALARAVDATGLPWYPAVTDMHCFQPLQSDARYAAILARLDRRLAALRDRLSDTLVAFDPQRPSM